MNIINNMTYSIDDYKASANKTRLDNIFEQTVLNYVFPKEDSLFFNKIIKNASVSFMINNKIYIILKKDDDVKKANENYASNIIKTVNQKLQSNYELLFASKKQMLQIPEYKKINKRKNILLTCAFVLVGVIIFAIIGSAIALSI